MPSSQNNDHALSNDSNIEINESHSLLFKLYANLLTNNAVQTGLKQITRFSQPLIGRFDDSLVKFTSNVGKWVSHETIYNQLANIWLALNFPVTETVTPYETFSKEFESLSRSNRRQENETALRNFYDFAAEAWSNLNQPSADDMKIAVLEFVAKTVNKTNNLPDNTLADALFNMLRMLIEKRKELITNDSFLNLIRTSIGEDFYNTNQQAIKVSTNEYYVFAKRFILIDFPLATNNKDVLKLIVNFLQDSTLYYGDSTLNFVERRLNSLLKALGQENDQASGNANISEKAQRILRKLMVVSSFPFKKVETVIHQVQNTKTYTTIDNYLHINDKIDDTLFATAWGYNLLKDSILEPGVNAVRVATDRARSQVTIIVHGLDVPTLKKRYTRLHAKYEVLQKCVVIVADETVKLIFDRQALNDMEENGKKELNRLYQELRTLQPEKIKNISLEYYTTILKKAQTTYKSAQKAIYYKKREQGDVEGAETVKPTNYREVDNSDDAAVPQDNTGSSSTKPVEAN